MQRSYEGVKTEAKLRRGCEGVTVTVCPAALRREALGSCRERLKGGFHVVEIVWHAPLVT
jgi:hypothetical protein